MTAPALAITIWIVLVAGVPVLLFFHNLRLYGRPTPAPFPLPAVSLLIPARNEERAIADCVNAALASVGVDLEVIVLDDQSEDQTAIVVKRIAAGDSRVRIKSAPALPPGWCGKQHACDNLARLARHPILAFIDADVRLSRDGLAAAVGFLIQSDAGLVSGIPAQQTGTLFEKLLIPLIHFVLLGFLPLDRMRTSKLPAYGAGCGQLFIARREAYEKAGGHAAIRSSLHDGIMLPRAFRRAGLKTDLFDATGVASCRMYRSGAQVWSGLAKNATEGMASPAAIVPWTLLLLGGQVLPFILLAWAAKNYLLSGRIPISHLLLVTSALAVTAAYLVRGAAAKRFGQSWLGAALHPIGVSLLVAIQWFAFFRKLGRRPANWRGRNYCAGW